MSRVRTPVVAGECEQVLARLKSAYPDYVQYLWGQLHYSAGRYLEARQAYTQCRAQEYQCYALVGLGRTAWKLGQLDAAKDYSQRSYATFHALSPLLLLAELVLDQDDLKQAEELLEGALQHGPNDITTWKLLGQLAERKGETHEAIKAYSRCLQEQAKGLLSCPPEQARSESARVRLQSLKDVS
ncbi:tetratricopeptide repeat protein [bacterium]|nr:tetratricopeptide repeat protein [bacterium]